MNINIQICVTNLGYSSPACIVAILFGQTLIKTCEFIKAVDELLLYEN